MGPSRVNGGEEEDAREAESPTVVLASAVRDPIGAVRPGLCLSVTPCAKKATHGAGRTNRRDDDVWGWPPLSRRRVRWYTRGLITSYWVGAHSNIPHHQPRTRPYTPPWAATRPGVYGYVRGWWGEARSSTLTWLPRGSSIWASLSGPTVGSL